VEHSTSQYSLERGTLCPQTQEEKFGKILGAPSSNPLFKKRGLLEENSPNTFKQRFFHPSKGRKLGTRPQQVKGENPTPLNTPPFGQNKMAPPPKNF